MQPLGDIENCAGGVLPQPTNRLMLKLFFETYLLDYQ